MNQTLQKIMLTTMALATSLALAHAGSPALSSSHGKQGNMRGHLPFRILPQEIDDVTYVLDDGTSEDAIGFGNGLVSDQSIWLNQFKTVTGGEMIKSVSVAWGTPANVSTDLNGQPVTIGVWSDPNGDGNPTDGKLLGSVAGTIQMANTDTFITYTFSSPVNVGPAGTSFFIGDMTPADPNVEEFYQAIDETVSQGRSWVVAMSDGSNVDINTLGNNDLIGTIDSFGLPGNWLVRGDGTSGGGGGLNFNGAMERSTHGNAGKFNLTLPGIDPFKGVPSIVFSFSGPIATVGNVTTSCGTVTSMRVDPNDATQFVVQLDSKDCNAQTVTVTLSNITDTSGNNLSSAATMVSFLLGDVNGDGTVDANDTKIIGMDAKMPVTSTNFTADISSNGLINAQDAKITRGQFGTSIGQ